MPGIALDDLGRQQIAHCARLMQPTPALIQSSPQARALQSASILANSLALPVHIVPAVDELDYGAWTGRTFAELETDPCWHRWNAEREISRPPQGESMRSLQRRVVDHLEELFSEPNGLTVAIVSHAEPIRAALLYYSGMGLDDFLKIEIEPASISTLSGDGTVIRLTTINQGVLA
jgi:probable phosphoglycerate mutase